MTVILLVNSTYYLRRAFTPIGRLHGADPPSSGGTSPAKQRYRLNFFYSSSPRNIAIAETCGPYNGIPPKGIRSRKVEKDEDDS